jgi:FHA domain
VTAVSSVEIDEVLFVLKIVFLVLLYLFIWRIVRSASRDLRLPQESFVLAPHAANPARDRPPGGRLTVLRSPALAVGDQRMLDSAPLTLGRTDDNDIPLPGDEFASSSHARLEPRRDGVWIEDIGSTNGTFVNGERVLQPRRLRGGDVIKIGETDLRFEG